jgi:hypothetical protein
MEGANASLLFRLTRLMFYSLTLAVGTGGLSSASALPIHIELTGGGAFGDPAEDVAVFDFRGRNFAWQQLFSGGGFGSQGPVSAPPGAAVNLSARLFTGTPTVSFEDTDYRITERPVIVRFTAGTITTPPSPSPPRPAPSIRFEPGFPSRVSAQGINALASTGMALSADFEAENLLTHEIDEFILTGHGTATAGLQFPGPFDTMEDRWFVRAIRYDIVPEPTTWVTLVSGLVLLLGLVMSRRSQSTCR